MLVGVSDVVSIILSHRNETVGGVDVLHIISSNSNVTPAMLHYSDSYTMSHDSDSI